MAVRDDIAETSQNIRIVRMYPSSEQRCICADFHLNGNNMLDTYNKDCYSSKAADTQFEKSGE